MPAEIPFTEELQNKIIELLASHSMNAICDMDDMPCKATIHKWYALHPNFHTACRRARDLCADSLLDEHAEIITDIRNGILTPEQAKPMLNALQWRIMQLDKARYGDKPSSVSITNNTDNRRVDVKFEAYKMLPVSTLDAIDAQIDEQLLSNSDNGEKLPIGK